MATAIVRRTSTPIEVRILARDAGLHPDLVARFIALGLLEDPPRPDSAALLARAGRLRRDLGLNYAGAVMASELLDRIDQLEQRLRRYEQR
jgi:hypothetical protein